MCFSSLVISIKPMHVYRKILKKGLYVCGNLYQIQFYSQLLSMGSKC